MFYLKELKNLDKWQQVITHDNVTTTTDVSKKYVDETLSDFNFDVIYNDDDLTLIKVDIT